MKKIYVYTFLVHLMLIIFSNQSYSQTVTLNITDTVICLGQCVTFIAEGEGFIGRNPYFSWSQDPENNTNTDVFCPSVNDTITIICTWHQFEGSVLDRDTATVIVIGGTGPVC